MAVEKEKDGQHGQVLPEMLQQKLVLSMPDFWCLSWSHSSSWAEYWTPFFFNGHLTGTLLLPYMVLTYLHWSWRSPIDGSARSLGMGWFSPCPLAPGTMRRGTMRNSLGAKKPGDQGRYKGWVVGFFVIADDLKLLGCWSFSWGSTKIAWNEGKRPKIRQQRWN